MRRFLKFLGAKRELMGEVGMSSGWYGCFHENPADADMAGGFFFGDGVGEDLSFSEKIAGAMVVCRREYRLQRDPVVIEKGRREE